MIELRKRLASMRLAPEQGIAEYLGEFREVKVNLEAAGQTVTDVELGFFALQGLPRAYATLVKILELGKTALSWDVIQPKLMQREQRLKLERELGDPEEKEPGCVAMAYVTRGPLEKNRATVATKKPLRAESVVVEVDREYDDIGSCGGFDGGGHRRSAFQLGASPLGLFRSWARGPMKVRARVPIIRF